MNRIATAMGISALIVVIHGAWHNNFRTFEMEMNGQINPLE